MKMRKIKIPESKKSFERNVTTRQCQFYIIIIVLRWSWKCINNYKQSILTKILKTIFISNTEIKNYIIIHSSAIIYRFVLKDVYNYNSVNRTKNIFNILWNTSPFKLILITRVTHFFAVSICV